MAFNDNDHYHALTARQMPKAGAPNVTFRSADVTTIDLPVSLVAVGTVRGLLFWRYLSVFHQS